MKKSKNEKSKKRRKKFFHIFDLALLIFVVFCVIKISVDSYRGNMPRLFNYSISKIETGSMAGTLEVGDLVLVKGTKFDDIEKNDIIVYKSKEYNIFIIHRVVSVDETNKTLTTKGDANEFEDSELITDDMVSGQYVRKIVSLGENSLFDNKGLVFGILMFVIFLVFTVQAVNIVITYKVEKGKLLKKEKDTEELADLRSKLIKEELEKIKKQEN